MTESRIEVRIASDPAHDALVYEIYLGGRFVALISCDAGPEAARIEFPGPRADEDAVCREMALSDLEAALAAARAKLGP